MTPGPGRVIDAGLQHSMATRDPNLEPRRETMCLLNKILVTVQDYKDGSCSPNMAGDLLTLVVMSIHEDPLDQVIAILITRNCGCVSQIIEKDW